MKCNMEKKLPLQLARVQFWKDLSRAWFNVRASIVEQHTAVTASESNLFFINGTFHLGPGAFGIL